METKANPREILISSEKLPLSLDDHPLSLKKQLSAFFDWNVV